MEARLKPTRRRYPRSANAIEHGNFLLNFLNIAVVHQKRIFY
jgi:hypothetical protein